MDESLNLFATCFYGITLNYLSSSSSFLDGLKAEDWIVGCGLHGNSHNEFASSLWTGPLAVGLHG